MRTLLPRKPIDELYTALGRAKQGKTERFRHFFRHLEARDDRFKLADAEKGMVMAVVGGAKASCCGCKARDSAVFSGVEIGGISTSLAE